MTYRITSLLAVVGLALGCGREAALPYEAPPADSYRAEIHQVKLGEATASVPGATVAPEFFRTAQVQPLIGRLFVEGDYVASSRTVVVLSHALWVEHFDSSPGIIGQEIEIDERRGIVVGVMPAGFTFPEDTRLWTPRHGGVR